MADLSQEALLDDCWNRIGVKGDASCPQLRSYVRCLNCPVHADAALRLLDRAAASQELVHAWDPAVAVGAPDSEASFDAHVSGRRQSALVFRIGAEWLALPTAVVQEVTDARPVHGVPHQRNAAIVGVLNIRGALRICVSLARLLEIAAEAVEGVGKYLLVVAHEGQTLVFPADEVAGLHRFSETDETPVPATLAQAGGRYTRALLAWKEHQVGLLDHDLLFYALNRSMA